MSEQQQQAQVNENPLPNFLSYHRSITAELHAVKDRIRNLARHWTTDGEHKEVALRSVLRRHLPESVFVGRGFIVKKDKTSTQIDVLIVDRNSPMLFKDGDLVIVTPDAVRGIIEVKTRLDGEAAIRDAALKLTENGLLCCAEGTSQPWTGLFDFDSNNVDHVGLLKGIKAAWNRSEYFVLREIPLRFPIQCVSLGRNHFVRYWSGNKRLDNWRAAVGGQRSSSCWRSYELPDLAPSYFLGNLIESISGHGDDFPHSVNPAGFAWFPLEEGKEPYSRFNMHTSDEEPVGV